MYTYTQKDLARFWTHVNKNGTPHPTLGPCWEWTSTCRNGYGMFGLHGKPVSAHRFNFFISNGQIDNRFVLHRCDNHPCIRPSHLFQGTHKDNMDDMYSKDRGQSILTNASVAEARALAHGGANIHDLAKQYGVSSVTMLSAVRGATFKRIENPCPSVDISKVRKVRKLSVDDVDAILVELQRPWWGQVNALAKKYGVNHTTISAIKLGTR